MQILTDIYVYTYLNVLHGERGDRLRPGEHGLEDGVPRLPVTCLKIQKVEFYNPMINGMLNTKFTKYKVYLS